MNGDARPSDQKSGWRAPILKHFTPEIAAVTRLTVVSDPDDLLTEEVIQRELRVRSFALMPLGDPVAFRFAYESRYRQIWDLGEQTNLVVVLRSASGDFGALPHDLLETAQHQQRCLSFSVASVFPNLAAPVVLELDRTCFDRLFAAQAQGANIERLGVDATRDYVLRHVFEIAPELITTSVALMRLLLRRHYRGVAFPPGLDDRLIQILKGSGRWERWPLEEILPNRSAFLAFLDERWPLFVKQAIDAKGSSLPGAIAMYASLVSGPDDIPFGHDDVKVYIDNLFQEGLLTPVDQFRPDQVPEAWMRVGITGVAKEDRSVRFNRLLKRLDDEIPSEDAYHRDWIDYALTWAEWTSLRWELQDAGVIIETDACNQLHDRIEARFSAWMRQNYASLYSLSPFVRPAMVHHIPHHMARSFAPTVSESVGIGRPRRHALVVVDGLALDQWVVLRDEAIPLIGDEVDVHEDGTFAWVPTLTAVSRQAIFAGTEPMFFADSLQETSREPRRWQRFWEEHGAKRTEVGYVREGKNRADEDLLNKVVVAADHPKMRMLAVVVGKVDQSLHGVTTGGGGLHAIIRQWARSGAPSRLLRELIERGFEVTLAADHGNILGRGTGKPNVGVTADGRGIRAHVFGDESTRSAVAREYPAAIEWPQIGLPKNFRALLAPSRSAFIPTGMETLGHGGIAMEEVIVPFVRITRRV